MAQKVALRSHFSQGSPSNKRMLTASSSAADIANDASNDVVLPFLAIIFFIIFTCVCCRFGSPLIMWFESCLSCISQCRDTWVVDRAQVHETSSGRNTSSHAPEPSQQQDQDYYLSQSSINTTATNKKPNRHEIEHKLVTKRYNNKNNNSERHYHHHQQQQQQNFEHGEECCDKEEHCDCPICLSSFQHGEEVAQSTNPECHHLFHTECIVEWLTNNPGCPACRRNFLVVLPAESTEASSTSEGEEDDEPRYLEPQCVFP